MIKVKLLVNTAYQGPRKEGEVISVPDDFANRWAKNKIAEIIEGGNVQESVPEQEPEQVPEPESNSEENAEPQTEGNNLEQLSAKELYALCKEKGVEADAKKSKEYYLEKLAAVEE